MMHDGMMGATNPLLPRLPKKWRGATVLGGHSNPGVIKDASGKKYIRFRTGQIVRMEVGGFRHE
jgi:hypothetical protein